MSEPAARPASPPKRRRSAISLRLLMVAIPVIAVVFAWKANRARDQHRAIKAIKTAGGVGWITYDWEEPNASGQTKRDAKLEAPMLLRRILGDEYFQEIVRVTVGGRKTRISIETLQAVSKLPNLTDLHVIGDESSNSSITLQETAVLSEITTLKYLGLPCTGIGDDAMRPLSKLVNLQELYLYRTHVQEGTKYLTGMKNLRSVVLLDSQLTDKGLDYLINLPSLEVLDITGNPVSSAAIERFAATRPDVTLVLHHPSPYERNRSAATEF